MRAGTRRVGWKTGEQEPRSLDKDLGQEKSGKGESENQWSSRPEGKARVAPTLG